MAKKQTRKTGVIQIQPSPQNQDVIDAVLAHKREIKTMSTAYAACELIREAVVSRVRIAELEAKLGGNG